MAGGLVINKKDFFKRLANDNLKSVLSSKEIVVDELEISQWDPTWEHRIIKNILFEKLVTIRDVDLKSGIYFENCEFKSGIKVINVQIPNYEIHELKQNANLLFDNCTLEKLCLYRSDLYRGILIKGGSHIQKIEIEKTKIGNGGIFINESNIGGLDINGVKSDSLDLTKSVFRKMVRVESFYCSSVSIVRSEFITKVFFWNLKPDVRFVLNYNQFEGDLELSAIKLKGLFSHGDTFRKEFLVNLEINQQIESNLEEIYIAEMEVNERFILQGGNTTINKLTIPFTSKIKGVFKFENCTIAESKISGVNEHAKLIFKRIKFGFLNISDFTNLSDLTFNNSKGNDVSKLDVIDSDLGLTKFSDFSFKSFTQIRIENAFLNRIVCSNIDWFNESQLIENPETTSAGNSIRNKRELFRQLKQTLSNNGNVLDSLEFQAKELQLYRKEKKESGKYSLGDRLIMWVNMTNNYGISWLKPLGLILLITLFFYGFLSILNSDKLNLEFSSDWNDVKATSYFLYENNKLYIELLNPARSFSGVYGDKEIHSAIYWLDSIHRVILGVFIFQIIKAFRKFVLK